MAAARHWDKRAERAEASDEKVQAQAKGKASLAAEYQAARELLLVDNRE
jgi:hypothetical protein